MREFEQRKAQIKSEISRIVEGRDDIDLSTVKRHLYNSPLRGDPLIDDGLFLAKMLNAIGWRRDGWLGTGYDRSPRYTPMPEAQA